MQMIKSTSIELKRGMLLSKEILAQMDFQSRLFKLQYESYPDGIVYGFEPIEISGILYLSPGLLKYQGKYYFSTEKINIFTLLDDFDSKTVLNYAVYSAIAFVTCEKEINNEGIVSDCLELILCDKGKLSSEHIIIAEFQYYNNKRYWNSDSGNAIEKLELQLDLCGEYYSFLNVRYSMSGENAFSPYICNLMKNCLTEQKCKSYSDQMLLFTLCQNRVVSFDVLKYWFESKGMFVNINNREDVIKGFLNGIGKKESEEFYRISTADFKSEKNESNTYSCGL